MPGHLVCPNCGETCADGDQFCRRCGWHLDDGSRDLILPPARALATRHVEQALLIGSATTMALSLAWVGARWLAPRIGGALARRLSILDRRDAAPVRGTPEASVHQVETVVWVRRAFWRRS